MKTETIRLGVVIDGKTIYPPGWVFLAAIALATGDEEAIKKADEARHYWESDFYSI